MKRDARFQLINDHFYRPALAMLEGRKTEINEINTLGISPTAMGKVHPSLFCGLS